jgi:transcriptional regulator of acetoin/glycerol metabolism
MSGDTDEVTAALQKVQQLLDRLTARGQHDAAFEIARAQFSASMRASWPANLSGLAAAIEKAVADGGTALSDQEREELRAAAAVLKSVKHG